MQGGRVRISGEERRMCKLTAWLLMEVEMSARHTLLPNKASKLRWGTAIDLFSGALNFRIQEAATLSRTTDRSENIWELNSITYNRYKRESQGRFLGNFLPCYGSAAGAAQCYSTGHLSGLRLRG